MGRGGLGWGRGVWGREGVIGGKGWFLCGDGVMEGGDDLCVVGGFWWVEQTLGGREPFGDPDAFGCPGRFW